MKKFNSILLSLTVLSLLFSKPANAAVDTQALYSVTGLINVALILSILICLIWSMRVMSLVKGGLMSKSWQMFTIGFVFLLFARFLVVSESINLFEAPDYIATAFYGFMVITWLIGIYRTKRILA